MMFIILLNFWSTNYSIDPSFALSFGTLVCTIFLFIDYILLIGGYQKAHGASMYIIDDQSLTVCHAVGKTKISLNKIENVTKDEIHPETHYYINGKGKRKRKVDIRDSKGNIVRVRGIPLPFGSGRFTSITSGDCVLLKLWKDETRVALTPNEPEDFLRELSTHVARVRG